MKWFLSILIFICIVCASWSNAETMQQLIPIVSNGETVLLANFVKLQIRAKIRTHEVQIGKPSDKRPKAINSSCTYSRYPCSLVDGIDIEVNGKQLFIPRSVFSDLADLSMGELRMKNQEAILTLLGGDASESYIVIIEFNEERIKHRALLSSVLPTEPLQETIYYRRVLGE